MTFIYLDETYDLSSGMILFPGPGRPSLWVEIRWKSRTGRTFTFTIEKFLGSTEGEVGTKGQAFC